MAVYSKGQNKQSNAQDAFSFVEDSRGGTTYHVTLKGRISLSESSHMEHKFTQAINKGCTHIIINMCFVKAMSSAGIRVILAMYKRLKNIGGGLRIENPSENVRNVIGMTALDGLLL
jgi:anti-anti-sigma factor